MKKLLTILLVLVTMMSLSVTAFAATTSTGDDVTIDVKALYADGVTEAGDKISVDIAWGAMTFTYNVSGVNTWNPDEHKYEIVGTGGTWTADGNTVTVSNHSNVAIKAELNFVADAGYDTISGSFGDNATLNIESAVDKSIDDSALTKTATLDLSGILAENVATATKVGTITVKIGKQ